MLVLIVDDDEDIRELTRLILETKGHDVLEAKHGGIGLDLVSTKRPDAVVLDLMMPEVDGFEFLARLPAIASPPPPVIVVSGFDTYRDEVTKLGAVAYLEKPVATKVLLQTLADALARRAPDPQLLQDHREANEVLRQHARKNAQELVLRLQLDDRVMPSLQALVDWLPRFFGFGTSIVQTLRGNDLTIEAVGGEAVTGRGVALATGMSIPRQWSFCDDLLDVGSSLVLPDAKHHRCRLISSHPEVQKLGWGFYLGVSIATSVGVIGALCHLAPESHAAHTEDAELLAVLATRVGEMLEAAAGNASVRPMIDRAGCFAEDLAPALVDAALKRALRRSRCGALLHVVLERDAPEPLSRRIRALEGLSSVLIRGPENAFTAILSGRDRDTTTSDIQRCWGPDVRAIGSAWWQPRPAPDRDAVDSSGLYATLASEAKRTLALAVAPVDQITKL